MAWEPGPFLPLVEEPVATDAAEELAGMDRLGELLVWGDRSRFHLGQRTRVLRHQHQATPGRRSDYETVYSALFVPGCIAGHGHDPFHGGRDPGVLRVDDL
jgi:hypothetical protein